jgi:mRNA interferase RelE/StbE
MASYSVVLKPSVEKDLRSLPKTTIVRAMKQIEELRSDPIPRKALKLESTQDLYRIRIGDYRVVYSLDRQLKQVIIQYIRHRREIYRKL